MKREVRRGDVYYARLPDNDGSVQAGMRPVIITQTNWLNRTSDCVIIVPLTSEIKNPGWNCHFILPKIKGLPKQSMVLGEQKTTISMDKLERYRCRVDKEIMKCVTRAVKAAEADDRRRQRRGRR